MTAVKALAERTLSLRRSLGRTERLRAVRRSSGLRSLGACSPRLQLVPSVDYAIAEHLPLLRVVRDTVLGLCILAVIGLAWYAFVSRKRAVSPPDLME